MPSRPPRIAIVGAGVAGLRAADVLLSHGVDVTILEARRRIGGRLAQSNHLGHLVDLGPNWIHGTNNNPMLTLAKETGTEIHGWSERQAAFDDGGRMVPENDVAETAETFWSIVSDAFKHSNEHSATIPSSKSLMDFVIDESLKRYNDASPAEARHKRDMLVREAEMWGGFVGGPTRRQSLKFFWLEECIDGENAFVASTYQKVLQRIAAPALSGAEMRLDTRVTAIRNMTGVDDVEGNVQIEMAGGTSAVFDEVVVTVPLGYLQRNKDLFSPALPVRLNEAISDVGYGTLDKVYITFPRAFWEDVSRTKHISPDLVEKRTDISSVQEHIPNTKAITMPLHNSQTDSKADEGYPAFTYWLRPEYSAATNPARWSQQAMNLAGLPASCTQPTLLFYIFGDCSKHVADLAVSQGEAGVIEFFKPYYSLLPGYAAQDPTCQPKAALATAWVNDELAGYGSYSNFQIGLEEGDKDIECMREGMPDRHIYLAGEHTAPFAALGTVTGAYWAGEEVARRISERYGCIAKEEA